MPVELFNGTIVPPKLNKGEKVAMLEQWPTNVEVFSYDEVESLANSSTSAPHKPKPTPGAQNMSQVATCANVDDYNVAKNIDWRKSKFIDNDGRKSQVSAIQDLSH